MLTAVLLTVSELFPPWFYEDEMMSVDYPAGYHWRFKPPTVDMPQQARQIVGRDESDDKWPPVNIYGARENVIRLFLQNMAIIALGLSSFLFGFNPRRLPVSILAWFCVFIGFCATSLIILELFFAPTGDFFRP